MDIKITAEFRRGKDGKPVNNPWRVSMAFPSTSKEAVDGIETIHTRVDAKDEKMAVAEGHAIFMRQLGRRSKGADVSMKRGKATPSGQSDSAA